MTYTVEFEGRVLKRLHSFDTEMLKRLRRKTGELAINPRHAGVKKLAGDEPAGYRIRVGDLRVLFTIDDKDHIVRIFEIEYRDKAYKKH